LGEPHPELSAISVLDSECASIHINDKNEVAFRPFGLDVPDELAGACQAVKEALTSEQDKFKSSQHPIFLKPSWKAATAVGKAPSALRHDIDLAKIKSLGTLAEAECVRMRRLKEDLSKDPAKAAGEQKLKADNVKHLVGAVRVLQDSTTDLVLSAVFAKSEDARIKREAARLAAAKAFSGEPLEGVGGKVWQALWDTARRYSTEVAYGRPAANSRNRVGRTWR
jgi:hypothetical protein